MIRYFNSLVQDTPFIGTLLICAIYGVLLGLTIGLLIIKPKKSLLNVLRIILILPFLPFLWKLFPVTFKSIFLLFGEIKGIGWLAAFFCFAVLVALTILLSSAIYKVYISRVTTRMQKTPVFKDVLEFIKCHNTTAVYCCHDGVRVIYDQDPHFAARAEKYDNISCKTYEEFKQMAVPRFTSCSAIPVRNNTLIGDFLFSKYGFSHMEFDDAEHFLLAICKELKNWNVQMYRKNLSLNEADDYVSTLSSVGGDLMVTSRKTKSGKHSYCLLDWYSIAQPVRKVTNMQEDAPAKKLKQW